MSIRWTSLAVTAGLLIRARARHTASFVGADNGTARVYIHGGEYKTSAGPWVPLGDDWTLRVPLECKCTANSGDGHGGGGSGLGPTISWAPLTSEEDGGAIVNDDASPCCLVAGATDGIGYAFYEAALRQGCRSWLAVDLVPPIRAAKTRPVDGVVYAIGRDFARVDTGAVPVTANRLVVRRLQCDIQIDAHIVACVAALDGRRIDTFVNCIGTFHKGKVTEATAQLVQRHFDLNCVANIRLTQAVRWILFHVRPSPAPCSLAR